MFLPGALAVITLSGFAGLIYESIWTHYLKLFLGHAAYAQSLVLMIFMGGMALGAWGASRLSPRWRNLIVAYAVIEAVIGLCALAFHSTFVTATGFAFERIFPALASAPAVHAVKWSLAAALILPQSVLLVMTFPLMTGGVLRVHPERSGYAIAMLYFTNSSARRPACWQACSILFPPSACPARWPPPACSTSLSRRRRCCCRAAARPRRPRQPPRPRRFRSCACSSPSRA
jgi:hypothetical protein